MNYRVLLIDDNSFATQLTPQLSAHAVKHGDEHAIKFTEVMLLPSTR